MAKRIGERVAVARNQAGLTQRELAARAGVPQSTVARIGSGTMDPRVGTIERERPGRGVDCTLIQEFLRLSPGERVEYAANASAAVAGLRGAARRRSGS